MKFISHKIFALIVLILIDVSISSRNVKNTEVKDKEFLKTYNKLKNSMIEEGSKLKNFGVKFISKTNRFLVATSDLKVKLIIKN